MAKSRPLMRVTRQSKALSKRRAFPYAIVLTIFLLISVFLLILLALGIFSTPISNPSTFSSSEEEEVENHEPVRPNHRRSNAESLSTFSEKEEEENHQHVRPRPGRSTAEASSDGLGERGPQWTEVMSWEPRAFVYHNFLSKEECNYLIELAKPHMIKSTVVDNETGKSKDSRVRTSSGTFIQRGRDKVVRAIEKRIADYTFIPAEHGEGLQILHYEVGQKYEPHFDYFLDEFNTKNGGQRMATFLMYLSHVDEGGETIFPDAKVNSSELHWHDELSECGKRGLGVKARAGDALLFWSMKPDTSLDPLSLHAGCPVIRGNKWSSTKWMHVNEYKP